MDFIQNVLFPVFPFFGIAGCLFVITAALIPALSYRGKKGESYSILNHFISELGEVGVSRFAWVFNIGLIVAGIILLPFILGMGFYISNFWAKLGMVAGFWTAISCLLVGVFPMNNLEPHIKVAQSYFRGGLVMVILFTIAILAQPVETETVSKFASIPGFAAILAFATFVIILPAMQGGEAAADFDPQNMPERPRFWLVAAVEWLVFFTTMVWFLVVAVLIVF
jgi:hypothetical protein